MRQRFAALFIGGFFSIASVVHAQAGQLEDGVKAYHHGDYDAALELLKPLAEKGVITAQVDLGMMYRYGHGVPKDVDLAAMWWRRAADRGNAYARSQLHALNLDGDDEAAPQSRKSTHPEHAPKTAAGAAELGEAEASDDVRPEKAQPDEPRKSQSRKGEARTNSVKPSGAATVDASSSADLKPVDAVAGEPVSIAPPRSQVAAIPQIDSAPATPQRAAALYRRIAEQGDANAQVRLADMYLNGDGLPQDDAQAILWFHKSAEQGNPEAQFRLGLMIRDGRGAPRDDAEALVWLRKAADQGDVQAEVNLAEMYQLGLGAPKDEAEAFAWYRKGADAGDATAQYKLALMLKDGNGAPRTKIWPPSCSARRPNKATPTPRTFSARSISRAKVCRRITRRPSPGSARPPITETRTPR